MEICAVGDRFLIGMCTGLLPMTPVCSAPLNAMEIPLPPASPDVAAVPVLADALQQTALQLDLRRHIPALDGLRGLAIGLVLLCHFLPYSDHPHSLAGRVFFFIGRCGWSGVDLFFVLSGFLITGILLDAKGTPHYFRNFYARRTLRIFPLYYLVLAVIFLVIPMLSPGAFSTPRLTEIRQHQAWVWLYGTNVLVAWRKDFMFFFSDWLNLNPFWSLAVEEHFYLVWPAVVYFCSRRALKWVCVGCLLGSLIVRAAVIRSAGQDASSIVYVFTPCRADVLATGGLLAVLLREDRPYVTKLIASVKWFALALGVAWLASLMVDPGRDHFLSMTAGYTLLAAFFSALLVAVIVAPVSGWLGRPFNSVALRAMGKYSYGLYVYHVVLATTFDRLFGTERLTPFFRDTLHLRGAGYGVSVVTFIVLASAASFVVAWGSWNLFEKRVLGLKRYFEYRKGIAVES
jgi:peptidoglycan/LPS O-acetylase OafA/YrhL